MKSDSDSEHTDKGIEAFIRDNSDQGTGMVFFLDSDKPRTEAKPHDFKKSWDEFMENFDINDSNPRITELHLSNSQVVQWHEELGDKGFKDLIGNLTIFTGSKGADYIQEFWNRINAEEE